MATIRSFAPFLAYATVSSFAGWQIGAGVALVLAVHAVASVRRTSGEADVLGIATASAFALLTAVAAIDPASPLHRYVPALLLGTLGLATLVSIAVGRPFTETFARRQVDPELWSTPLFRQANNTISAVWAASFLVTGIATATMLGVAPHAVGMLAAIQVVGVLIPFRFTSAYRARLRARRTAISVG